jgi:protein pelota
MRILKRKLKTKEQATGEKRRVGELSLVPDSLDDLWHLKHVVEPGDLVYSVTYRRLDEATDKVRPDKVDKKPLRLGIRTAGVEFHKFSRRLRIKGMIEAGPETELGAYHTFNIEPGVELSVVKEWKEHQLKRLREAEKAVATPEVLIVTIEEGEAIAGVVRQYGVDELFSLRYGSGKGMERVEGGKAEFFGELLRQVQTSMQTLRAETVIIAGPGFIKEDFVAFLKERDAALASRTRLEQVSSIGISGFLEVLKRGAVERLKKEERLTREVTLLDRLLVEISKDVGGKAVYGAAEVAKALDCGAVETLLVSDEKLMKSRMEGAAEEREAEEIDRMLEAAERQRGAVVIFSTEFEPGKRLKALGGIAALLRFGIF